MHFKSCILTLLSASLVSAAYTRCGTAEPTEEQKQTARRLQAAEANMTRSESVPDRIDIDVYFHVIDDSSVGPWYKISRFQLHRQMGVLNYYFNRHSIYFDLVHVDIAPTPREGWSEYGGCAEKEMTNVKDFLHKGTYADLNVYFYPRLVCLHRHDSKPGDERGIEAEWPGTTGYVYNYPVYVEHGSKEERYDGVHVQADTVPGGILVPWNQGKTLVHEVGHWLGLFHTFEGETCDGPGDYVDDTPAETLEYIEPSLPQDTCPSQPGMDSVENFMGFSIDSGLKAFTKGQVRRMFSQWAEFRAKHQKHRVPRKMRKWPNFMTMPTLNATTPALDTTTPELGSILSRTEESLGK